MIVDTKYMYRCLQLASKGRGYVSPNPMVGAVLVHNDRIIGEGYHQTYGEAHAEVNAIAYVKEKELLKESTLYVSLEPCSHYGKTPPCAQLIIDSQIPRVVVGCLDPFPQVAGRGIKMLEDAGVKTKIGLLEKECLQLNKEFNTAQEKNRPYIYLKWAQTNDGYIDRDRTEATTEASAISSDFTKMLVHKLRAETDAIMVATNTAIADNPSLTTRLWQGDNPVRIIIDRTLRIPEESNIFDNSVSTIVFTESDELPTNAKNTEYLNISFDDDFLENIFKKLKKKDVNSVMVEGGSQFLQSLIDSNMWDEAFVEIADAKFGSGIKAPHIEGNIVKENYWGHSKQIHFMQQQV